ncbi:MAG: hypothetical protein EHM87_21690 [Burkholderiales bacterium]|nr:MAG: hypothetical protein EHM87_21690 [Burkholderiales bacterium]
MDENQKAIFNKYFKHIEEEDQLDRDFAQELKANPLALLQETAKFFRGSREAKLDNYRCARLAALLLKVQVLLDRTSDRDVADAYQEGWTDGWDSYRVKAQTMGSISVTYGSEEFDDDWGCSQTKKKLEA